MDKATHNSPRPIERGIFYDFHRLADRSLDAIYHYAIKERRYLFLNRRFVELFGLERISNRTIPAEHIFKRIHPEDRNNLEDAIESVLTSGTEKGEMHYRLLRPGGAIRWLYDRWIVLRERGAIAIGGFIRDITEEKMAVEECIDSMQNAPIGAFTVQGNKFKYVNAEFIRITGYTQEALLDSDPFIYIHEDYREYAKQQAVAMLKGKTTTPYEFCIHDKNGEIRWIMETVTPIYYGGRRATLGYFMDITRLHKAQLNLSSLGLMIGTISHSLKGCLTGLESKRIRCPRFSSSFILPKEPEVPGLVCSLPVKRFTSTADVSL